MSKAIFELADIAFSPFFVMSVVSKVSRWNVVAPPQCCMRISGARGVGVRRMSFEEIVGIPQKVDIAWRRSVVGRGMRGAGRSRSRVSA